MLCFNKNQSLVISCFFQLHIQWIYWHTEYRSPAALILLISGILLKNKSRHSENVFLWRSCKIPLQLSPLKKGYIINVVHLEGLKVPLDQFSLANLFMRGPFIWNGFVCSRLFSLPYYVGVTWFWNCCLPTAELVEGTEEVLWHEQIFVGENSSKLT